MFQTTNQHRYHFYIPVISLFQLLNAVELTEVPTQPPGTPCMLGVGRALVQLGDGRLPESPQLGEQQKLGDFGCSWIFSGCSWILMDS